MVVAFAGVFIPEYYHNNQAGQQEQRGYPCEHLERTSQGTMFCRVQVIQQQPSRCHYPVCCCECGGGISGGVSGDVEEGDRIPCHEAPQESNDVYKVGYVQENCADNQNALYEIPDSSKREGAYPLHSENNTP